MPKKKVTIIGGGPSALSAAYFLSPQYDVIVYEKEKNIGQKFLVAGKGGFNLTNSLTGLELLNKYSPKDFLKKAILSFDSVSTRKWLKSLGVETYVGTSGRVLASRKLKPFEILEKIKVALINSGINIFTNYIFAGFDEDQNPIVNHKGKRISILSDYYVFALGGASWPVTGSDGKWLEFFDAIGIATKEFEASNCGVNINWPDNINNFHIGKPLKNIEISAGGTKSRGEAVITEYGLEGNIIYTVVPKIRELLKNGEAEIRVDFKPNNILYQIMKKLHGIEGTSSNYKKILNLTNSDLALLKSSLAKNEFLDPKTFVNRLKQLTLTINSLRPIEEAISTVGGISISNLNQDFSLKKYPNIFTVGEMVDWDAPTGGYLLQGCFSMGYHIAKSIKMR